MIAPYLPTGCLCVAMGVMEFVGSWYSVGCVILSVGRGAFSGIFLFCFFFCI